MTDIDSPRGPAAERPFHLVSEDTAATATPPLRVDLAIIGGGMVGMSLAIACSEHGIKTALIEAEPAPALTDRGYDGRSSAIAYGSQQVLKAIGVWDLLKDQAQPILDIRVTDGGGDQRDARRPGGVSPFFVHYSHRDLAEDGTAAQSGEAPPFGYIVENRISRVALFERLKACPNVSHIAPATAMSFKLDAERAQVSLHDGRRIGAALVVAADGRQSALRGFAGIGISESDYRQSAIVCTVVHEKPHHGVAHEHFLPAGPFAMLPMTDDRDDEGHVRHRSSIVWTEDPRLVPMLLALDDDAFGAEIERRFGLTLGRVRPLGPRFSYPLKLLVAEKYLADRMVLVGDAAHGIHPIAGQGFNLGIRDVAALAEVLVDARRLGQDIGSPLVLERYARWRRFDNLLLVGVTDGLTRLFSNDLPPLRLARDLGFALFNKLKPAKRLAMRHAMGLVGDLPKLVRGKPL
ncbi:UbiH/UbiF/VisC/COQ6 family ubiquinone biosynthesis hydroxylase [Dongia soli]|uniref:UbiH/UbiF/VisC/COQ6 family ubiquinone biosynthesis hydroxylase n=1 Tax=Dongia soli TaxID=600628 RepID=A0ABU5E8I8_9PROT|nr:UbiH/UbiF/VisC/COQ6 family ubiquinone biosynthesis hydroxylase [Dongia soli]MDY0882232.1 UbiH/UbiF/VisC/COQ6 family ubiquinone biosynthesis hydroxylase [Dongia soli]